MTEETKHAPDKDGGCICGWKPVTQGWHPRMMEMLLRSHIENADEPPPEDDK